MQICLPPHLTGAGFGRCWWFCTVGGWTSWWSLQGRVATSVEEHVGIACHDLALLHCGHCAVIKKSPSCEEKGQFAGKLSKEVCTYFVISLICRVYIFLVLCGWFSQMLLVEKCLTTFLTRKIHIFLQFKSSRIQDLFSITLRFFNILILHLSIVCLSHIRKRQHMHLHCQLQFLQHKL